MNQYNQGLHDLLNHLRDQPSNATGFDMLAAAKEFISDVELGERNIESCIPQKLQAYSPQPKEPIMTDDTVEAAVEPTAPEIDQSPVSDPISLEADAIAAAEAIKKLAVDAFEEI